jgi:hypothetical protein
VTGDEWSPTRWWRVVYAAEVYPEDHHMAGQPRIWCETSDEAEARDALGRCPGGGALERGYTLPQPFTWREVE